MAKGTTGNELRAKSDEELTQFIATAQKNLLAARFQNHTSQLNDTSLIAKLRHDVARGKTIQAQRVRSAGAAVSTPETNGEG